MAIQGVHITTTEVQHASSQIKTLNKQLTDKLNEIKKEMDNLNQIWKSEAGDTIIQKFKAFAPQFQQYEQVIANYATFLDSTAQNYSDVDSKINSNASAFK